MTALIDFNKVRLGEKSYDGADTKDSIFYQDKLHLLKLPKKLLETTNTQVPSYANNPLSEYIGCHIFDSVGINVQKTLLGTFDGKVVVACEDFMAERTGPYQLQEFNTIINSVTDRDELSGNLKMPELSDIEKTFSIHRRLSKIKEEAQSAFWDMFVVDAFIANFDRHVGNWGYIANLETGHIVPAPVYDCGSSLYAQLDDNSLGRILEDKGELNNFVLNMPRLPFLIDGQKLTYREFILNSAHMPMLEAVLRIAPKIKLDTVRKIIASTPSIHPDRKEFLSTVLEQRYAKIIAPALKRAQG